MQPVIILIQRCFQSMLKLMHTLPCPITQFLPTLSCSLVCKRTTSAWCQQVQAAGAIDWHVCPDFLTGNAETCYADALAALNVVSRPGTARRVTSRCL